MKPWRDLSEVPMPAAVARLPRDERGYPIPETVEIAPDGRALFPVTNPDAWVRGVKNRLCGICGDCLDDKMVFVGGPLSIKNRSFFDLPMHEDCARYALQVCPYLAAPKFGHTRKEWGSQVKVSKIASNVRPDLFGMGMTNTFKPMRLGDDVFLLTGVFTWVEWWQHGHLQRIEENPT